MRTDRRLALAANISWKYYGEGWDLYVTDPTGSNTYDRYCNICNPFQYATSIMTNPALREEHINDVPTCSKTSKRTIFPLFPLLSLAGSQMATLHLRSSTCSKASPRRSSRWSRPIRACGPTLRSSSPLTKAAAITILGTFSQLTSSAMERVFRCYRVSVLNGWPYQPLLWDHVSIIKFIERNWGLQPLTNRSRDNFPNP